MTAKIDKDYNIHLDKKILELNGIRPGQEVEISFSNGQFAIINSKKSLFGIIKNVNDDFVREDNDRTENY